MSVTFDNAVREYVKEVYERNCVSTGKTMIQSHACCTSRLTRNRGKLDSLEKDVSLRAYLNYRSHTRDNAYTIRWAVLFLRIEPDGSQRQRFYEHA